MKKKAIMIGITAAVVLVAAGVSVIGANELLDLAAQTAPPASERSEALDTLPRLQPQSAANAAQSAALQGDVQEIITQLSPYGYPQITVQKGIPVKWTIIADENSLNACNDELIIPALAFSKRLQVGENILSFTPEESGIIEYSCWMGMIHSAIAVVDDINGYDPQEVQNQIDSIPPRGGCCG